LPAASQLIGIFDHALERRHRRPVFSKSFLGYTTYKMALVTREGLLVAILPHHPASVLPVGAHQAVASGGLSRARTKRQGTDARLDSSRKVSFHRVE